MPSVVAFLTDSAAKIAALGGFCKARRAKPIVQRQRANDGFRVETGHLIVLADFGEKIVR
jgi:hypothetical protein